MRWREPVSPEILFFLIAGIFLIAVRRVYQGALIHIDQSWAIIAASFLRIATTIPLALFLPHRLAGIETAMYILLLGAVIDTIFNICAYHICSKRKNHAHTYPFTLKEYIPISLAASANLINNYWIILT
ncbi:MAG: hypothetical protein AAF975_06110, partial [Spirochaetota bacterium]